MNFGVLGPLSIQRDGREIEIGAAKQRALLIHLLLRSGQTVPVDRLIDALWGDDPPPQARVTLRSYVSSLRRILDAGGGAPVIVTRGNGYGVDVDAEAIDAARFVALVGDAREAATSGDPAGALELLDRALALWRGDALADLAESPFAVGERTRLEELRLSAHEDRFDALLALGRNAEAVAELEAFVAEAPLRDRAHGQLMLALYRSGRAPDALAAFTRYRETLAEELGLDPGSALQLLADRILRQDEELDRPQVAVAETASVPVPLPSVQATDTVLASAPSAPAAASIQRLVGRAPERAELQGAVERLIAGSGALLLIAGEAGIGKSTLLEELADLASEVDAQVRWGRCQETKGAPAFWPWIQIVRDLAADLDDTALHQALAGPAAPVAHLVDSISARLPAPPPAMQEDVEAARFQLYEAIATFLLNISEQRPLVLLLDDLHWADAPSLETLSFLTPHMATGALLVAAAYRDARGEWPEQLEPTLATAVREASTQQMSLVGLHPGAVAELVERLSGETLSPGESEVLQERTGGNPFFVRQLSQLLRHNDGESAVDTAIPSGVRHVIARRLALLPPAARALLEAAAVAGGQFDARWLVPAAAPDAPAAMDAANMAAEHGMIEPVGRSATSYRFVHALVRETIYDGLSPGRAARLHAALAEMLEGSPNVPVTVLAEHFWRAADLVEDDRPLRYLQAAANQALEVFAHEQAELYLRRALELMTRRSADPATEMAVRARLTQLLIGVHGWPTEAVEEIAGPGRLLGGPASFRQDVILLWSALFAKCLARGEANVAADMTQRLLAEAGPTGHPVALAAAHTAAAHLAVSVDGDTAAAVEHGIAAEKYAERAAVEYPEAGAHQLRIRASHVLALALAASGDAAGALDAARRALDVSGQLGEAYWQASATMGASVVGVMVQDADFTAEVAAQSLRLREEHGFEHIGNIAAISHGWALAQQGADAAEQAQIMTSAVEAVLHSGHVLGQAKSLLYIAETHLLAGDPAAAGRALSRARDLAARHGEPLPDERLGRAEAGVAQFS